MIVGKFSYTKENVTCNQLRQIRVKWIRWEPNKPNTKSSGIKPYLLTLHFKNVVEIPCYKKYDVIRSVMSWIIARYYDSSNIHSTLKL